MTRIPAAMEEVRIDGYLNITLDFPIYPTPRYGWGRPSHQKLSDIIGRRRPAYRATLEALAELLPQLRSIAREDPRNPTEPFWMNQSFGGLDAAALYGFVSQTRPARLLEIGSGNSTKFIRRAIADQGLATRVTCVDPYAADFIDTLADVTIRETLEDTDLGVFDQLEAGDIVFFDASHRCFENSDATVFFLDVLPELKPGVLVQIHDICLPDSYPPEWTEKFYSEQYLLAAYLLAEGDAIDIVLPNYFIYRDPELHGILAPLWTDLGAAANDGAGASFWFRMK